MNIFNKIIISTLGLCCIIGTTTFAANVVNDTRSVNIILEENAQLEKVDARTIELQRTVASKVSKYDLRDKIDIEVYDQGNSEACWSFSLRTAFETNLKSTSQDNLKISNMHMAYATSNSFSDGQYKYGLERDSISEMGTTLMGLGYLTNGSGPVDNFEMPFSDVQKNISVSEIENKTVLKKTEGWRLLSSITKSRLGNQINYTEYGIEIGKEKVIEKRNEIKNHIMNYGAVTSSIRYVDAELPNYYNDNTNSYYYNGNEGTSHAITIIGWDDNYSKDNFKDGNKPINDGAYLVQNSYGDKNTYFYVSYDDTYIEAQCYGITKINYINYHRIYQHDEQGANVGFKVDDTKNEMYVASIFERDSDETEFLNEIALTTLYSVNYEIYVNTENGNIDEASLKKVNSSITPVKPGYYTIKLQNPLQLTGDKFAVVIKYKRVKGETFGMTLLSKNSGFIMDWYNSVQEKGGECYAGYSLDKMNDVGLEAAKTCIKAFTRKIESKFDLSDKIKINSKNQETSNNCWTMPITTVLETNRALKDLISDEMSAKHMDYATSQSFTNGAINEFGYNRLANTAGTAEWGLSYFTNGSGPVYEMSMPFTDVFDKIDISEITNKTVIAKVEDWIMFPRVFKEITNNGIKYTNENNEEYTQDEIENIRNKIKLHIMNNGAISTETYIDGVKEYYNSQTNAYYCDDETKVVDHGVAIIGWDDNYPKENFKEGHQPEGDGAYIVQNSWGQDNEVAEKYYISYYDPNVEKKLYGIVNVTDKDNTETIYQYDELGRNTSFSTEHDELYGANVFTRDNKEEEYLKEISISTYCDMNYEVYVNSSNGNISSEDMKLVAQSNSPIENGYHTIKLDEPIKLTGDKFVVAVKYMGVDETLVSMQAKITSADGKSPYQNITSNEGESYVGVTLDNMTDMKKMEGIPEGNLCIKAFTQKTSSTYSPLKGDVNLDGHVTATDISLLKLHLVGIKMLKGYAFDAADLNADGKLSAVDLSMLKDYILNIK